MVYFTSDTHYFHRRIIPYCDRPFPDLDTMHSEMIRRWNARVTPEDTVYHLGDFCFGNQLQINAIVSALQGKIILVRGNHDRRTDTAYKRAGISEVHKSVTLDAFGVEIFLRHHPDYSYENKENAWHIHGHVHLEFTRRGHMANAGVDVRDFEPKTFSEIFD